MPKILCISNKFTLHAQVQAQAAIAGLEGEFQVTEKFNPTITAKVYIICIGKDDNDWLLKAMGITGLIKASTPSAWLIAIAEEGCDVRCLSEILAATGYVIVADSEHININMLTPIFRSLNPP